MSKYSHDTITPYSNQKSKKMQVAEMFNNISNNYDFMNRFMSGGVDIKWRKKTISELKTAKPNLVLDVATGTGDIPILMNQILLPEKIIGVDISEGMLKVGKEKIVKLGLQKTIDLQVGDSENLNFPTNYFDAVTVAYGVRNFENLEKGLAEIFRVLRPNGKLVILEATKPENNFIKFFSDLYCLKIIPKFGGLFGKNKKAYLYLNNSIQAFPQGSHFLNILIETGFTQTYLKSLSLGVCTIYCGSKPSC